MSRYETVGRLALSNLAHFLETDRVWDDNHVFWMGSWVMNVHPLDSFKALGSCGFAGCAIGSAIHFKIPGWEGLSIAVYGPSRYPMYKVSGEWEAVGITAIAKYLGISLHTAQWLFEPSYYEDDERCVTVEYGFKVLQMKAITPAIVAERIRTILANNGMMNYGGTI